MEHLTSATNGAADTNMLINSKVRTGVSAILSAAHRSKDGILHGHTWEVVCWWTNCPDAVAKKAELTKYLSIFDHTVLAENVAWGEKLAQAILVGMNCDKVEVNRPLERIFASVERA